MKGASAVRIAGSTTEILPSVQWLRGIAAMMVVIHHLNFHTEFLREKIGVAPSWFAHIPWSFEIGRAHV